MTYITQIYYPCVLGSSHLLTYPTIMYALNFKYDSLGISYNFFYWGPWGRKMIPNSGASGSAYYLGSFIYVQRL